jgi:hypothetical protein
MELRTKVKIEPSPVKITYNDKVLFLGSCFASSIGKQMQAGKFRVLINPAGTVFNPVSVCNTLDIITSGRKFETGDLYFHNGTYLSLYHYTDFSSYDPVSLLDKINSGLSEALGFLKECRFLFITLGTARVYRLKETGQIVSNCHKIPSEYFTQELLTVHEIRNLLEHQLDRLRELFPEMKVIFTISPVRHLKDGAHGNQISKSLLLLSVEELLAHHTSPDYFPAYELVMDELRDYRFYDDDMMHPSALAINYIWDCFSKCYMDSKTLNTWNEVVRVTKACRHLIKNESPAMVKVFAQNMLNQISVIENRVPQIDFSPEKAYFQNLLK